MYHTPVLLAESLAELHINPNGVYVDATFGGGGHSRAILEQLGTNGRLYSFDQDEDALQNTLDDTRFKLIQNNFRHLRRCLRAEGVRTVDGILADLGVSSYQFDTAERGFSYRFDGVDLDMRMNQQEPTTAATILNTRTAEELQTMFGTYGEVRNSRSLALRIIELRQNRQLQTIQEFLVGIDELIRGNRAKYLAQVFQALRIEVNDEVNALKDFMTDTAQVLKPETGRLVVIAYHSLEDRLVKQFIKYGTFADMPDRDDYGNFTAPFIPLTKKPIEPTAEEQRANTRSHSAKMRVAKVAE